MVARPLNREFSVFRRLQNFRSCLWRQPGGSVMAYCDSGMVGRIPPKVGSVRVVLAVVALLSLSSTLVIGLPLPPPDLFNCKPLQVRKDLVVDCCLPTDVGPVKEFQFPDPSEPMRIRKNAANIDAESIAKYNEAYRRMRALPPSDPRSMWVQQNIHCGYCTEAYKQQNSTKTLEIHRNWLLLPFHRWYVYFHERILASLIDDPTFTIPYWNWDNQSTVHIPYPNAIPEYFYTSPSLFDENREASDYPPDFPDLHQGPFFGDRVPEGTTKDELRVLNNAFLHESIVSGAKHAKQFLGGLYRFDDDLPYQPSLFEIGPHASIHGWVGNSLNPKGEDMEPSYSAARDPIFYAHHSNVDRLFRDWHDLGGTRKYPVESDWTESSFLFFDEIGELVRVTVNQSLDIEKLRYTFEPTENGWLEDPTSSLSKRTASEPGMRYWVSKAMTRVSSWLGFSSLGGADLLVDIPYIESVREPKFSSTAFHSRVARPHASLLATGKLDELEEVLVIDGIWVPSKKPIWFQIFVNLPQADENTPLYATEWCGRFSNGPHLDQTGHIEREAIFSITIGDKLKKLGIVNQPTIVVSLVPVGTFKHEREVQIKNIRLELQ